MAGDNEALGNSIIITGVKAGFIKAENTAPDMTSMSSVQVTWSNSPVDVEPERIRWKASDASSITFMQLQGEATETWNIVIEYEIYTNG